MELVRQQDKYDCGVANCVMIVNHYSNAKTTIEDFKLTHKYNREEYSLNDIKNLLSKYHIEIDFFKVESIDEIVESNNYPIMLVIKNDEGFNHYVIVNGYKDGYFEIYDPNFKTKKSISFSQLRELSLDIVGYIKKTNSKEEKILNNSFNKKYWYRFYELFKYGWKTFLFLNLLATLSLFCFFLGNMFIKVLLTEYSFLTFKRAGLIVMIFIAIVTLWVLLLYLQRVISRKNNEKVINLFVKKLDEQHNLSKANFSFSKEQQLDEINNLSNTLKQQLYLLNNFIGFSLFTVIVIYLTANISLILLTGTLILIICLMLLKIWHVKRIYLNNQLSNLHNNRLNYFNNLLIENYKSINQKIELYKFLNLNEESIKEPNFRDQSLVMYLEKLIVFIYYFFMIFTMYDSGLDVSLFLVITNITFVFSNQLERILNALNYSFISNKKMKIINNLKATIRNSKLPRQLIVTNKGVSLNKNIIRVRKLENILINHKLISFWLDEGKVFDCSYSLVDDEIVSNNLFNYGQSNTLENYEKFNVHKILEKFKINLSRKTHKLSEEQKEIVKVYSSLFTNRKIILIKKNTFKWFSYFEKKLKENIKDKVVIIYEE